MILEAQPHSEESATDSVDSFERLDDNRLTTTESHEHTGQKKVESESHNLETKLISKDVAKSKFGRIVSNNFIIRTNKHISI